MDKVGYETMVHRVFNVIFSIQSYFTRLYPVPRTGIFKPLETKVRYFTGKAFPVCMCQVLQTSGTHVKDTRFVCVKQYSFNSISPTDLAKDIAAMKNAGGYLDLYSNFKNSSGMTQVNRITILHNLAKFASSPPKKNFSVTKNVLQEQKHVFFDLLDSIGGDFSKCKPRDLASIVWALGKLRENVVWFVMECEKEILKRDEKTVTPPAVCQFLNGFASLDLRGLEIFSVIEQRVIDGKLNLKDFENRGLSAMLWSFAKTGNGCNEFYEKMKEEILQRDLNKFSSQQLGQFLWSFGVKGIQCNELVEVIKCEMKERSLESQTNEGIKRMLRSLAKLKGSDENNSDLFQKLGEEILARGIHDFETGDLAILAWSFAKMCPKMEVIFDFLEEEIGLREVSDFRNHELSLLLWSFAKVDYVSADLFNACQEEILSRNLSFFKAEQLSQLAWAFAKSTVPSSEFYIKLERQITDNLGIFSDNELCMIARGFAHASAGTVKLFKEIEEEVLDRKILNQKPNFIPELAWVFSKCSYQASSIFDEMGKVLKSEERFPFKVEELKIINKAFSKAGKDLPFKVQHKKVGRHHRKSNKQEKFFHLNSKTS